METPKSDENEVPTVPVVPLPEPLEEGSGDYVEEDDGGEIDDADAAVRSSN
jgi:hypothetical protein